MTPSLENWKLYLSRALKRKRLGHSLLVISENENVKKNAAHYYAKLLLCERQKREMPYRPCEGCVDCIQINAGQHMNVESVSAASNGGIRIEQVRELRESLRLRAFNDKPRLIILADAHSLTMGAANALLKSIEEPSDGQYFLIMAPSRFALPRTLLSRCQSLVLPAPSLSFENEVNALAKNTLTRIRQGDLGARTTLIEELIKNSCDKSELLLEIQRLLHLEVRACELRMRTERLELLLKPIEALEVSRTQLERNVNAQLVLENCFLNTWPASTT